MGEAKRRRDARGVTDERTSTEIEAARLDELRRIERHTSGRALRDRLRASMLPAWTRPVMISLGSMINWDGDVALEFEAHR